jgi:signal transduction histidine kinase
MSEPIWIRSLYSRIAFGFIALLAVLLLAQGLLFLWLTDRIIGSPTRTPVQLAEYVAHDVAEAMSANPELDLGSFVPSHFRRVYQPFDVALIDGRHASNHADALPPNFSRVVERRIRLVEDPGPGPGHGRGPAVFAPIVVAERQIGIVGVPGGPPPVFLTLRLVGPTLTWVGFALLALGVALTALLVFRPARRRLRSLEHAAAALGEGRTDVRADEAGGDEVSALARTFNRMAADLESRAAALTQSDRIRRQLLADVSHELMTPLSAIRGYVETLQMPTAVVPDDATRVRYLDIVHQETQKLEAIVGDLLDLAKLEGGGDTIAFEPVEVASLFRRVEDRHGPALRDRHLTLEVDIAPGTPEVEGDAARLEQAIQNLAANAIRHVPPGGRITLTAEPAGDRVRIAVRDTGPGIPPEHLDRIFDRFYKVDASRAGTTVPSGSGLGLSIVRATVLRHHGEIHVSNAPDGGAVFTLLLPVAR